MKTLRHYVAAFFFSVLVMVAGGLALAAFWEGGTPFSRQPATSFPTRTAQTMQRAIQQALTQHGIPAAALQASGASQWARPAAHHGGRVVTGPFDGQGLTPDL